MGLRKIHWFAYSLIGVVYNFSSKIVIGCAYNCIGLAYKLLGLRICFRVSLLAYKSLGFAYELLVCIGFAYNCMGSAYNFIGFGAYVVPCTFGHPSKKADFWDSGFGIEYVGGGRRKQSHRLSC